MAAIVFKVTKAKIDSIDLDCSINESHAADSEVTQHPVEKGADITDHVRLKPLVVQMEGLVSDATFPPQAGRWRDAYRKLMTLRDQAKPFTLVTALREYTDMVLVSLTFPRDIGSADSLKFSATLQQVVRATSQTVIVPRVDEDKVKRKVKKDKKATEAVASPPSAPARRRSTAVQLGL